MGLIRGPCSHGTHLQTLQLLPEAPHPGAPTIQNPFVNPFLLEELVSFPPSLARAFKPPRLPLMFQTRGGLGCCPAAFPVSKRLQERARRETSAAPRATVWSFTSLGLCKAVTDVGWMGVAGFQQNFIYKNRQRAGSGPRPPSPAAKH